MRFVWILLLLLLPACQRALPLAEIPDFEVAADLTGFKKLRPVAFESASIEIKRGTEYVAYPYWRFSFDYVDLSLLDACNAFLKNRFSASVSQWSSGSKDFGDWKSETADFVLNALSESGYDVVQPLTSSFHQERIKMRAEILISAHIKEIQSNICNVFNVFYFKDAELAAGNATITVEWEVFDRLKDKVVARLTTQGLGIVEKPTQNGNTLILLRALEDAARHLAHTKQFQNIVQGRANVQSLIQTEQKRSPLRLKRYIPKNLKPLHEKAYLTKRAIVAIGEKEGTGFFISPDGYILTSLKNVGEAQNISITDSQGTRLTAQVIRKNDRLEIALLKADMSNHTALPIADESLTKPLMDVFTIGNPSDFYARNTLGRGTISSWRTKTRWEQNFIQASIPTTSGYAGAPLMDEYGRVLGIHDGRNTSETNFSFYVPIWDALRALKIEFKNS